jgi:hypothetical protein
LKKTFFLKYAYLNKNDNINKLRKKYVYNFNTNIDYNNEWDHLQAKLKQYTKMHETNGWENLFQDELIIHANDSHKMH